MPTNTEYKFDWKYIEPISLTTTTIDTTRLHHVRSLRSVRCFKLEHIKKIIINEPATIILWQDGTKTVVKLKDGDVFDPEKGILLCILKKMFDNSSTKMSKWLDEQTAEYYDNLYSDSDSLDAVLDTMQSVVDNFHELIYGKSGVASNVDTADTK